MKNGLTIAKLLLSVAGVFCLITTSAPTLEAQAGRAARRASKEALRRGTPKRRPSVRRIQPAPKNVPGIPAARKRPGGVNPNTIERLMRMQPEQRRQFLRNNPRFQRLPKAQRDRIQRRLAELEQMPPRRRELALQRYQLFHNLPREKQQRARQIYRRWQQLPSGRRQELMSEFRFLRHATPEERRERFASKEFDEKFPESEQEMLRDLTELLPR